MVCRCLSLSSRNATSSQQQPLPGQRHGPGLWLAKRRCPGHRLWHGRAGIERQSSGIIRPDAIWAVVLRGYLLQVQIATGDVRSKVFQIMD